MKRLGIGGAALCILALNAGALLADSKALPVGRLFAYSSSGERGQDSSVVVRDAVGKTVLTIANATEPKLSPDGKSLAFIRIGTYLEGGLNYQGDLFVASLPDGKERQLTKGNDSENSPAWSPDGKTLAFATMLQGNGGNAVGRVELIGADGSGRHAITGNDGSRRPAWHPNGRVLCFVKFGVCRMDATGKNRRRLTKDFTADYPSYSPDGKWILFSSGEDEGVTTRDGRDGPIQRSTDEVSVMRNDGTGAKQVCDGIGDNDAPCWSPDGKFVAFTSDRVARVKTPLDPYDEGAWIPASVYILKIGDRKPWKLTDSEANEGGPNWR